MEQANNAVGMQKRYIDTASNTYVIGYKQYSILCWEIHTYEAPVRGLALRFKINWSQLDDRTWDVEVNTMHTSIHDTLHFSNAINFL